MSYIKVSDTCLGARYRGKIELTLKGFPSTVHLKPSAYLIICYEITTYYLKNGGIPMEVFALVGPSGTGKSYRAMGVARDNDIDYLIDDGILISGNRVIAGTSAKREETKVGAVKRAIFKDSYHRESVRKAIIDNNVNRILILGTSDSMVEQIAEALGLPQISKKIYIREISTLSEIKTAVRTRREQGKHVIPVPTFEIKKDFSGYFLDPLKVLRMRGTANEVSEKSVVRPTFSYLGKYVIADSVVEAIASEAALKASGVYKINICDVINNNGGIVINIHATLVYGNPLRVIALLIQEQIKEEVEYMTGLNIIAINVTIKSLIVL